jgi:hypothetical protein
MRRFRLAGAGLLLLCGSGSSFALEWSFDDWGIEARLNTRITAGAMWRMQDRNLGLLGKLNVPGQMNLCEPDNCLSLSDDPAPNQRLVNAAGAFSGVNGDDGNINYDRGDLVATTIKVTPDLTLEWGNLVGRLRAIGFYDPINVDFDETHFDTRLQPARTRRPDNVERVFARGVNLYEANLQYAFTWDGRQAVISAGNQIVRWGESTLVAINSLAEINPPNAAILRMPGVEIAEVFQPVPLVLLSTDLFSGVSAEFLYQFGWKAVQADPRGSFFADLDLIDGNAAAISLGQFGENPDLLPATRGELAHISRDPAAIHLMAPNEPKGGGQYGLRLNYFADWLNGGTEMSLYFLNYHSRLPYASLIATQDSCARDAGDLIEATISCNGYNGELTEILNPGGILGDPIDPLPIRTLGAYLDYPENLKMFGFSFTTNIGSFSLAGEVSYRPDFPLQTQLADLIFFGLTPALPVSALETPPVPACDVNPGIDPLTTQLCGLQGIHFPSADEAIPSHLARYRGHINSNLNRRVREFQAIPGYERRDVLQAAFTTIKAVSNNPFGADQILFINEIGATFVMDMPDIREFQFQGAGVYFTSAGLGADGTGTPSAVSPECDGTVNPPQSAACHLTPTTQTDGFADAFSWGLRSITRFEYNDVIFGWSFLPTVILQWDIGGIAPFPIQNFVEGRKDIAIGSDIKLTDAWSARFHYQWFTGGGANNTRSDRDNLALSVGYTF